MTNEQRAHKEAAKASKSGASMFVVYVFDQGYDVYDAEQCRLWAPLVMVEACYVSGVKVASVEVAA